MMFFLTFDAESRAGSQSPFSSVDITPEGA
jgi:hypothetical protein